MNDTNLIEQCLEKAIDEERARVYGKQWGDGIEEMKQNSFRNTIQSRGATGLRKQTLYRALEIACETHGATATSAAGTIAALESDNGKLRATLESLMRVQGGPPLPTYEPDWSDAMDNAAKLLGWGVDEVEGER
jgi:hypothetical protein